MIHEKKRLPEIPRIFQLGQLTILKAWNKASSNCLDA
jgi:hypothetical protein